MKVYPQLVAEHPVRQKKALRHTFPAFAALLLNSRTEAAPWVKK
jgi:hypothetical protein